MAANEERGCHNATSLDLVVLGADSVTVRSIAGDGDQAELLITIRRGSFTLRLIGRSGRMIRFTELLDAHGLVVGDQPLLSVEGFRTPTLRLPWVPPAGWKRGRAT